MRVKESHLIAERTIEDPAEIELGVVMPVFNEERWLVTIVQRVLARSEVSQLVAVDDGSTDTSWKALQQLAETDARVRIVRHEINRGKGAAIRTGFQHLDSDLMLIQDADLEYDPADYPRLLEPILNDEADVVYGSRFLGRPNGQMGSPDQSGTPYRGSSESTEPAGWQHGSTSQGNPRWHTLGNRLLTAASNRLTGLSLTDEATCYKLFRKEILDRIELQENGFGFCPEVTAKVARMVKNGDARLVEVPVSYHGRTMADGKKIRLRDGVEALRCLWRYTRNK